MNLSQSGHPAPAGDTLRELCAHAAAGDESAFERIHTRLGNGLKRFLRKRVGRREDVIDELSQRAWIAAWEALQQRRYDPERAAFTTFLYGVGYKLWLQHARASPVTLVPHDELDDFATALLGDADPAHFLRTCELLDAVRNCLHCQGTPCSLSDDERDVLLGVTRGESEREMAARLRLAPSTINARKCNGLHKLRTCLGRKGFSGREHPSSTSE